VTSLKETQNKISALIYNYFEDKIQNLDFREDTEFEDDIRSMIDECEEDVMELLRHCDKVIDDKIEDWEADYNESYETQLNEYLAFREDELNDMDRRFYFTR
jgi:hypothetical protein